MVVRCLVRRGAYYDSLVLMQVQQSLVSMPGVAEAGVIMGTADNREVLARSGLLTAELEGTRPDELVIAVRAETMEAAQAALARVDELLVQRSRVEEQDYVPKSLETAARLAPLAEWVVVSVPGRYAGGVARRALDLGKNVFLFSDHVPLVEETGLKRIAGDRGLLVLGPECGTAIIGGIGFGFANRVKRGPVGLVSASGTGLQQVACAVDRCSGVSHALGTGGRDLADEVGGATTLQALDLLRRDPETQAIVLISKPPSPCVAGRVLEAARRAGKPAVVYFLGYAAPVRCAGNLFFASSLEDAAELAVRLAAGQDETAGGARMDHAAGGSRPFAPGQRFLRGLYSGGTLAAEALHILQGHGLTASSNIAAPPDGTAHGAGGAQETGHTILDLGSEEFTQGRPHPMISQDERVRLLLEQARDPGVAVLLLDLVLGDGAHPDPARELAPACASAMRDARASGRHLEVIAVVVGTQGDPQDLESQIRQMEAAGVHVALGNGAAIGRAAGLIRSLGPGADSGLRGSVPLKALESPAAVLNVGLEWFAGALAAQGVQVLHVDWRPPAGGDDRLGDILRRMRGDGA